MFRNIGFRKPSCIFLFPLLIGRVAYVFAVDFLEICCSIVRVREEEVRVTEESRHFDIIELRLLIPSAAAIF